VPILTPGGGLDNNVPPMDAAEGILEATNAGAAIADEIPSPDSYLPDLNLIADFGQLVTRDFPASPLVGLSRDLMESEQCAEYVSCETSRFSLRHGPLNWLHK
jgi:hypothetical protein